MSSWELSPLGFTIYELSDESTPVNLWSAQVQRDPRRFTGGQAADVARLMRAAKEMAEALEATVEHGAVPAAQRDAAWHKQGSAILTASQAALRSAGRLP